MQLDGAREGRFRRVKIMLGISEEALRFVGQRQIWVGLESFVNGGLGFVGPLRVRIEERAVGGDFRGRQGAA